MNYLKCNNSFAALGDGRGLLLGEVEGPTGKWDVRPKGAGKIPKWSEEISESCSS
ncbi:MAG: hypothetical protein QNL64_06425 [Porticoccus sp.]|uniref:hypothetical protein n=1 Tax=Porticoccus sp. Uisw_050_02 TaxID=3230978 RepID=UPI0030A8B13C